MGGLLGQKGQADADHTGQQHHQKVRPQRTEQSHRKKQLNVAAAHALPAQHTVHHKHDQQQRDRQRGPGQHSPAQGGCPLPAQQGQQHEVQYPRQQQPVGDKARVPVN